MTRTPRDHREWTNYEVEEDAQGYLAAQRVYNEHVEGETNRRREEDDFLTVLPVTNIVSVNLFAIRVNPALFNMPSRREAEASTPRGASNPGFFKTLL